MPCALRLAVLFGFFVLAGCAATSELTVDWPGLPVAIRDATGGSNLEKQRRADARAAHAELLANPTDESAIIWYGRRVAYLGLYDEAIDVYTRGRTIYPDSPKLLRHRGHRHLSKRNFVAAVADFERAAKLIEGQMDAIEPDGIPNARNMPTSSLHTNIWYHLGLARYCRGEFEKALACYEHGLQAVARMGAEQPKHDMAAATRYWKFLAATRAGNEAAAKAALDGVEKTWDIIENHAYHKLLLLFRGDLEEDELGLATDDLIKNTTAAYGLARYRFLKGDAAAGRTALEEIAAKRSAAFGCIAAEADLARAR